MYIVWINMGRSCYVENGSDVYVFSSWTWLVWKDASSGGSGTLKQNMICGTMEEFELYITLELEP
jgi:hypothetical protein